MRKPGLAAGQQEGLGGCGAKDGCSCSHLNGIALQAHDDTSRQASLMHAATGEVLAVGRQCTGVL
jgi:hypothetical protein